MSGLAFITDPNSSNKAAVTALHNADNQAFGGTTYGLLTGGVAQMINSLGNLDRQRETGFDGIPAAGIATGTQQLATTFSTTIAASITGGAGAQAVTPAAMASTLNGTPWSIQVGSQLLVDTGAAQEKVVVTAVTATTFTTIFANNHTGPFTILGSVYNQARDASVNDGSSGIGLSPSAALLFNATLNAGAGGWEKERSALGELDGATGVGTAVAAEYECNSGGPLLANGNPSGLAFDRARNLQGKGLGQSTLNGATLLGATSLVLNAVAGLTAGQQILVDQGQAGQEILFVAATYTPGALTVTLASPAVAAHANAATVKWDVFAALGPGTAGFLPTGVGIEEEALYDPVSGLFYLERAATQDGISGNNIVLECEALYNGAAAGVAFDRRRSASAANLAGTSGIGAAVVAGPGQWGVTNVGAAAAQPTTAKAAVAAVRHVCTGVSFTVACGATAQATIQVNLRDGATGAGAILQSWLIACPANDSRSFSLTGLNLPGSVNTAMTLEFAGATAATVQGSVSLTGYDAS